MRILRRRLTNVLRKAARPTGPRPPLWGYLQPAQSEDRRGAAARSRGLTVVGVPGDAKRAPPMEMVMEVLARGGLLRTGETKVFHDLGLQVTGLAASGGQKTLRAAAEGLEPPSKDVRTICRHTAPSHQALRSGTSPTAPWAATTNCGLMDTPMGAPRPPVWVTAPHRGTAPARRGPRASSKERPCPAVWSPSRWSRWRSGPTQLP